MCEIDNAPYIGHLDGDERGWYISLESVKHLNKDGAITHGVKSTEDSFWPTKEAAQEFLSLWGRKGWFQIKDCDELSIGEHYFYYDVDDKMVALAEFDGNSFSCEAETIDFDADFSYGDFWFKEFSWPEPPQV